MRLIIYRKQEFPSEDLIFPACRVSKRYCQLNQKKTFNIGDLKELQRKGYDFKYKIKDWKNLQVIPVKGN